MPDLKPEMDVSAAADFLVAHLGEPVGDVQPLAGGFMSRAFAFVWRGGAYVVRFAAFRANFDKDRFAHEQFASAALPIPRVLDIGEAGGRFFAISERATGVLFLDLNAAQREAVLPAFVATLDHVHGADMSATSGYGDFDAHGAGKSASWRRHLLDSFDETQPHFWHGWRSLFRTSFLERDLFERGYARMLTLLDGCPEGRALIHNDYSGDNVLTDGRTITGVIDWGNALYGDFLWDVASLDLWLPEAGEHFRRLYAERGREIPDYMGRVACYRYCHLLDSLRFNAFADRPADYAEARAQLLAHLDGERGA